MFEPALKQRSRRGITLIEVLVTVIILSVLVSVAIPLYLRSVQDAEDTGCKTNMKSIASAVQANRAKTRGPYFDGPVDAAAAATTGPLADLENAVPRCPQDTSFQYTVDAVGDGFEVLCGNPAHTFKWKDGGYVP